MAAHYRNGGLPPWAMATDGVKAPLQPNDYNANSGISYPPIAYSNPKAQHENPTQFGVYGNVPPSNTQTMGLYSNATGMAGYMGASYHTANTVSSTPPPQSSSPQPQAIGHSQYMSMTSSYEPYGAPQTMYNPNPTPYAPPPTAPTPTLYRAHQSPAPGSQSPYSAVPTYVPTYDSPSRPMSVEANGSVAAPAYSGSGGAFGTNEYRKDKGWEYTAPPVGSPTKQ